MEKLVELVQFFQGSEKCINRYWYLLDNPSLGEIVTDYETYIGKVIKIKDNDHKFNYKHTYKALDVLKVKKSVFKMRKDRIIKDQEEAKASYYNDLVKTCKNGYYIDPNYGYTEVHDEDIDWSFETKEPTEKELEAYFNSIMKELRKSN